MSTKRDLVEAHGYNRRRLVSAFVSGAPGGREVEPVRHTRTVVGGVVLAVLLIAGAAVSGFLQKPPPKDWDQRSLVIGADSGSRFFAYQGTLFPVLNITSARLLMGEQLDPLTIGDDLISEAQAGPTIGIQGAPEVLPTTLVDDGWTACTSPAQGVLLSLGTSPVSVAAPDSGLLARSDDGVFLVAGRFRYPVAPGDEGRNVLRGLGYETQPVPVPNSWINLFDEGGRLGTPRIDNDGARIDTGVDGLDRVGTPVDVAGNTYVLGSAGTLVATTAFTHEVLQSTRRVVSLDPAQTTELEGAPGQSVEGRDWPETVPTPLATPETPCVRADLAPDELPEISLATPTGDVAVPRTDAVSSAVAPGIGAVVRGISGGVLNSGAIFLVDGSGTAYALGRNGNGAALGALGYADRAPRPIPQSWLALLDPGPELAAENANRPVSGRAEG